MSNLTKNISSGISSRGSRVLKSYSGEHISKMGYPYIFESDKWLISGSKTINFALMPAADPDFLIGFRAAVSRYAEEQKDSSAFNVFFRTKKYLLETDESQITVSGLMKYKNMLSEKDEWQLGAVKAFWLSMYDWGLPGIDKEAADILSEMTIAGNEKGAAVLRKCPYTGPLTKLEQSALLEWCANNLEPKEERILRARGKMQGKKKLTLEEFAYLLSLMYTGRRAVNILSSRFADLSMQECKKGIKGIDYIFKIPRAKQRDTDFREEFNPLPIDEDLYLVLTDLVDENVEHIEKMFGAKMSDQIKDTLPLFIHWERMKKAGSYEEYLRRSEKTPDFFQETTSNADHFLRNVSRKCTALSERTGDYILLSSRRLRYTKGTNLNHLGISGTALAWCLDHSDTQNIGVYTDFSPKTADILNKALSEILAPLAQAFAGTLIDSERDALRANDPHSRIKNDRSHSVGSCGTYNFCAFGHRSCYTCKHFQPWRDAPHHEVLADLLVERKRQEKLGVSEEVIQATDRVLLAVQDVINKCKELVVKADQEEVVSG